MIGELSLSLDPLVDLCLSNAIPKDGPAFGSVKSKVFGFNFFRECPLTRRKASDFLSLYLNSGSNAIAATSPLGQTAFPGVHKGEFFAVEDCGVVTCLYGNSLVGPALRMIGRLHQDSTKIHFIQPIVYIIRFRVLSPVSPAPSVQPREWIEYS